MSREDCVSAVKNLKQKQAQQIKKIASKYEDEIGLYEDLRNYFKRRLEIEHQYYEEQTRLCNEYLLKRKPKEERTTHKAWFSILEEFKGQFLLRENFVNFAREEMVNMTKLESEEKKKSFTKLSECTKKVQYSLHFEYDELTRFKQHYDQCEKESQRALQKYEETQRNGSIRKIFTDQKSAKKKYKNASQKSQEARNEYLTSLESANAHQKEYYSSILPSLMKRIDGNFFDQLQSHFSNVCKTEVSFSHQTIDIMEKMDKIAQTIVRETENNDFINENNAIFADPQQFVFEPYNSDQVAEIIVDNVSRVSLSNKLAKKKKHLSQVIAQIDKKSKEIEGLLKITSVYSATPEFGKSATTNEEIENIQIAIEELNLEKRKLEAVVKKLEEMGVEVINPAGGTTKTKSNIKMIALYPYQAQNVGDLSIKENDIVTILDEETDGWIKGEVNGQVGMVPVTYLKSYEQAKTKKPGSKRMARALYDFEGKEEGDLSFSAGDLIEITNKDDEWWEGVLNGKVGTFPGLFVEEEDDDASQTTSSTSSDSAQSRLSSVFQPIDPSPLQTFTTTAAPSQASESLNIPSSNTSGTSPSLQRRGTIREQPVQPPSAAERVQALYDYSARFEGELSFRKGDIITVKNKNTGSPEWWEGTIANRVGQFPKSYVRELPSQSVPKVAKVRALYDYAGQQAGDLSIKVGDVIELTNQKAPEDWLEGKLNGKVGLFPKNYVESI